MCGIVGVYNFASGQIVSEEVLGRMRDSISHRGPDGAGLWLSDDKKIGLAFRRLAIIDLSDDANQPMSNEEGTVWIVFNGEIYNHAEIRVELEQIGTHTWKTDHSDTEVILHAFEQWGIDCLDKFRGMFAFALWDSRAQELWLVRDRIGIKPLYFSISQGRVIFASEIKAIFQNPAQQKPAVHEEAFYHYLSFLTTPAPQTLFQGINKLAGGTWLRISADGRIKEHRYWDVWEHTTPLHNVSEDEIAEMVLVELRAAVRLRKVSDVPVGVFLSGGIDSSTNTALFSEGEGSAVKTFSIGYEGENPNYPSELKYARRMAEEVNAKHHERILNVGDLVDFLPLMVRLQDEPIADPVCVPVYYVSKLARESGVTVCQVGEGADELFLGYPSWKRTLQFQGYDDLPVPRVAKKVGVWGLRMLGKERAGSYEWLRRGSLGQPVFWGGAEAFTEAHKQRLLAPTLRKQLAGLTSWDALQPIYQRFQDKAWEKSSLNWMTYLDLNLRLPELLLMRVDKMSMGVGLEGRVPFLDHEFVQLAMSIPTAVKTSDGTLKYILKKAVRGLIPDELIDRKKQGFGVPLYDWFYGRLEDTIRQELNDLCDRTDFLNRSEVMRYVDGGMGPQAWYLLNFAMWWKEYVA